jgi:RES domain-containing protein
MIVYRIVKKLTRAKDLSGIGAFKDGGRWNNEGTYMLYTSENSSLAYLESLVHFGEDIPPNLYIMRLEIANNDGNILHLLDNDYPADWMEAESSACKILGDSIMAERKYLAIKVRSKVNPYEYNYLLNPLFPRYHDLIDVISIEKLNIDIRLI